MGIKSTVGSIGNMLGPALVVMITSFVAPQVVFLISAGLVLILTVTSGLALHTPQLPVVPLYESQSTISQNN
jgi:hypothetical protein